MAGQFLRSHGIDINAEMSRIQNGGALNESADSVLCIKNVSLPGTRPGSTWNVNVRDGRVESVLESEKDESDQPHSTNGNGALLTPSLCHPHIHIDKAYLLSHPRYAHLQVEKGDFQEAMTLTGKSKARFELDDLLERGKRVIDESVAAGVTHMRAFVEVDAGVKSMCLDAGIALRNRAALEKTCNIQLCAFAQLPLFSSAQNDENGDVIRELMRQAASNQDVDVIGSTPYVETDRERMERNVEWMVELSMEFNLHLDFHLDYNLDPMTQPLVWKVIQALKEKRWKDRTQGKTIVLGHCTRLTLFGKDEWQKLALMIADLPIFFIGLPNSDIFMMRTGQQPEIRGTLNVPTLIKDYGINACIGVNNIGNAFTPQGSCDPLSLAYQGVGLYQAGTKKDTELLFECVSTRAKDAISLGRQMPSEIGLSIQAGDKADFVLFDSTATGPKGWHTRRSISEAVYLYDQCKGRRTFFNGNKTAGLGS